MKGDAKGPKDDADLRRKAEERLHERTAGEQAVPPEELTRLVHELHVHQIELEMQNDELRRTQTELETARSRYFDIRDLAPAGYLTLDEKGRITEADLTAARMLGVDRGELVGQPLTRFIDAGDQDAYYQHRRALQGTRAQDAYAVTMKRKDGATIAVLLEASVVPGENGAECRVVISDITEQKRALDRYLDPIEDVAVGILTADVETKRFISANPAICRLLGYSEEELLRMGVADIHPRESLDHVLGEFDRKLRGEKVLSSSLPCIRKDGAIVYADVSTSKVLFGGRACLAGFFVDVTARRQAEHDYKTVLETAIDGFVIVDGQGRFLESNDAHCRMTGYTRAELLRMTVSDVAASLSPEKVSSHMATAVAKGMDRFNSRIRRKDGRFLDVDVSIQFSSMRGGVFLAFVQDITELKRTEAELKERIRELAESEKILRLERVARASEIPLRREGDDEDRRQPAQAPSALSPSGPFPALPGFPFNKGAPWLILLVALLLTSVAWHVARNETTKSAQEQFDFRVRTVESTISERLAAYEQTLRGAVGLFSASDDVTRDEWRAFVTTLQIGRYYPGVQGLGFSKRILPSEKEAHIRGVRGEGFPRYEISPAGDRPEYTSTVFLEPFDSRNQRAFGYDMFSEPVRREAMTRARDTGLPAASGKVRLVQETGEDVQAGFLLYLPVYRNGATTATPEERRAALRGYVYSPFRMNDFMRGILDPKKGEVDLRIFSGNAPRADTLLFRGGPGGEASVQDDRPRFAAVESMLEFAGQRWLLAFSSSRRFEELLDTGKANTILALGLLVSLLLFGIASFMVRSGDQAIALAGMASARQVANRELKVEIKSRRAAEAALGRHAEDLEAFNQAMVGREVRVIEMKQEVNTLCAELGREPRYPPVWQDSDTHAGGAGRT